MIHIAYVIDTIITPGAGTEKQLLLLIQNLDKNKFKPHLICLRNSEWLQNTNHEFPVLILDMKSFKLTHIMPAIAKFKRYCKNHNIKIVQTFFRDGNFFGTIAAYLSGIKVIVSSRRNYGGGYWHNWYWLLLLRIFRFMTTLYISNSHINAKYVAQSEKVKERNIHVIHNGLILDKFISLAGKYRDNTRKTLDITENQILIGIVANMRPVKNLILFVKMAAQTTKCCPQTMFLIIGEGEERPLIENLINDFELKEKVILVGKQTDVLPYLASIDIGVLCSKSESLSNSIIEYMAAGIPSVVSDVGGNAEATGGVGGLVFQANDLDEFCEKVGQLISDEALRISMGEAAKSFAFEHYDLKKAIIQHEEIYTHYYKKQYIEEKI